MKRSRMRNPEAHRAVNDRFRAKHREKILAAVRVRSRVWYRAHRERWVVYKFLRRARKAGAGGCATAAQVRARIDYYGGVCAYCGGPYEHLDHVIALARGGTNWPANLRPSCACCNLTKHVKRLPLKQAVTP